MSGTMPTTPPHDPRQNCYCGGPDAAVWGHTHGFGRYCRPGHEMYKPRPLPGYRPSTEWTADERANAKEWGTCGRCGMPYHVITVDGAIARACINRECDYASEGPPG